MEKSHSPQIKSGLTFKKIFFSVIISYSILFIWFATTEYNQKIKKAKDNGLQASTVSSLQVQSTFEQVRNILIMVGSEFEGNKISLKSKDEISKYLFSRNMLISDIEYLLLTNERGDIIGSSNNIPMASSLADFPYFMKHGSSNGNFIVPIQKRSLDSNEWVIPFVYNMHDYKNKFMGVVEAGIPLSFWHQYLARQLHYPSDEIAIVDIKTCAVLGTSYEDFNGHFKSRYAKKEFCEGKLSYSSSGSETYFDKKLGHIISYVILPEFKVAIVMTSIFSEISESLYTRLSIIALLSALIFFWFWRLIKYQLSIEKELHDERIQRVHSSKMAALGEMAGGIAHEINTPLTTIGLVVETLCDSIEENDYTVEELQSSLGLIKSTADRIGKIINGLRFFARDGSALPMEKVSVDLIVEETLSFCSERMCAHHVSLKVVKNYQGELILNCRATEISQVLLNLLNNAYDAVLNFSDKWIHIVINDLGQEIEINVIDSGKGISPELQDKIMQPFFTTKDIGKGTGLGLSISRGIIDSHRGKMFVDKDFANTKFTIILPKQ
jgi:signal transduction histidine kinase